jgi:hypothetical protein
VCDESAFWHGRRAKSYVVCGEWYRVSVCNMRARLAFGGRISRSVRDVGTDLDILLLTTSADRTALTDAPLGKAMILHSVLCVSQFDASPKKTCYLGSLGFIEVSLSAYRLVTVATDNGLRHVARRGETQSGKEGV